MKTDGVGDQVVFRFAAIELIHIWTQVDIIKRRGHTDQRVIAGGAVAAQWFRGIAPAPAIGQQDKKILLAPVTNR